MASRDCTHPRAGHRHGTLLAYQKDGCRCEPCRAAASRENKLIAYRTVTKTHTYVDAGRARAHVEQLLSVLTIGQVEQRSGVHRTAIRVLIGNVPGRPASKRITRSTQAALLAVRSNRVGSEESGWVDATGTQRRLRALVALGWTARHLTTRLGMSSRTTFELLHDDAYAQIRARTRATIAALYDELALTVPAPSRGRTLARGVARRHGWPPPLAWDDDSIDDPAALPDLGEPDRVVTNGRPWQDVLEDFQDTRDSHLGDVSAAAMRLDMTPAALAAALYRARAAGVDVVFHTASKAGRAAA